MTLRGSAPGPPPPGRRGRRRRSPRLPRVTDDPLRPQPENIYEFGAQYFTDLVREREADALAEFEAENPTQSVFELDGNEMSEFILQLFMENDTDGNGLLDRFEFKEVLRSAELGLNAQDIRAVLAQADENDDGLIEYKEFLPLMVEIMTVIKIRDHATSFVRGMLL